LSYVALYRVWRPARWEDVVDQKAVVRILKNALKEGKVSHAYLFSGPRGTGKTTVARLLAKAVNCQSLSDSEPCNKCRSCVSIGEGSSVDVIEIDAASNRGIDEIRSLRESVRYVPVMGQFKVYIIDEVHMLTQEAFNALLKTLEEPPEHVIFVMATTAPHKIPLTITSRCQRLDFRRLSIPDIEAQMEKILSSLAKKSAQGALPLGGDAIGEVKWEKNALRMIARAARGSMRDALSILDLCLTYGGGRVNEKDVREILGETSAESMMRLFRAISQRDIKILLGVTQEASDRGKDMGELCEEISEFARDLLLVRSGGKPGDIGRSQDEVSEMTSLAKVFSPPVLISVLGAASRAAVEVRNQDDPRLVLEMCLLGLFLGGPEEAPAAVAPAASAPQPGRAPKGETPQVSPPPGAMSEAPGTEQTDEDLIESVKSSWPKLLEGLSQGKRVMARAYLMPASPSRIEGGKRLLLAYPQKYGTHMEQIMVPENKSVVEQYLQRLVKRKLEIGVEVSELGSDGNGHDGGNGNGRQDGDGGDSSSSLHPLVKAAITMVDGKVVP
jgi:DNA polymerase-3 subunit gamma/tau